MFLNSWLRTSTISQGLSISVEKYIHLAKELSLRVYIFPSSFFFKFQFIGVRMISGLKVIFAGSTALPKLFSLWPFPGN